MGIKCSQPQNSISVFYTLNSFDEKEQQSHQASQTLNYSFPQKQILESIKTKLKLQQEQNLPQQPDDPGSPMQALSENTQEGGEFTKFNNSCPTTTRINRSNSNQISFQHNQTSSIKNIHFSQSILNKKNIEAKKGIIKKSRYNSDSQSPSSIQTIKSVRFLVTEQIRLQTKSIRTKSLCRKSSTKLLNSSTIYSNRDQSQYYKIVF
ncbi:unnamed protein product [Paramecium octaurelia]|uniref:Uncharacterized protein n=1 Tax=Paramecium octaurelia TaxID=43137 RepID=A0A8S1WWU2_PAROT|nr:unnamed protein product [Paramecium octaurelia]